nr:glycoprotein N acetylgalactosamine [Hymenolepis microstoma]
MYAYEHHADDYDYFLKANDDTYVIVENLRYKLSTKIPDEPFYMGRRFVKNSKTSYPSGGAGYVISRGALNIIAKGILEGVEACRSRNIPEDHAFGICADALGVLIIDSLDEHDLDCFHPFRPLYIIDKELIDKNPWIHTYNYHPMKTGSDCCSDHTVSFHYISPDWMYMMEYLIYHLYPYGIARDLQQYDILINMLKSTTDKLR